MAASGYFAQPAAARPHHPRARLILLDAKLKGRHYAIRGENTTITFEDVVKNVGGVRARSTRTELSFYAQGGEQGVHVMDRRVPPLDPNHSHQATSSRSFSVGADNPLGAYDVKICADYKLKVNRASDPNTCEYLRGAFFVVKRNWTGSFNGAYPVAPGVSETWTSENARFVLDKYDGGGRFRYDFRGGVDFTESGGVGGCTYAGVGTAVNPDGTLTLDLARKTYSAYIGRTALIYTIEVDCPGIGADYTLPGPLNGDTLVTGRPPLPFGTERVEDHYSNPINLTAWNWKFG